MAEFENIKTQEDLDAAINAAVQEAITKYSDYDSVRSAANTAQSELKKAQAVISTHASTVESLNKKIADLEQGAARTRIANELGLPLSLSTRLSGSTDEEIRADAQKLMQDILGYNQPALPLGSPEPVITDKSDPNEPLLELLRKMKGD